MSDYNNYYSTNDFFEGRDSDDIARVEEEQECARIHRDRRIKTAYEIRPKLESLLVNFKVPIDIKILREVLKNQKSEKRFNFGRTGKLKGQDKIYAHFSFENYGFNAVLRSNPRILEVKRELYINSPYIKGLERIYPELNNNVTIRLESKKHILFASYNERTRPDSYHSERGFFIPLDKFLADDYLFTFINNSALKQVKIPEKVFDPDEYYL